MMQKFDNHPKQFFTLFGTTCQESLTKQDTMPQNSWLCADLDERDQHKYGPDNKY